MLTMTWWAIPALLFVLLAGGCGLIAQSDIVGAELLAVSIFLFGCAACLVIAALCYAFSG